MKVCHKCSKEQKLSEFFRDSRYNDGYKHYCKSCLRIYNREYMRINGHKYRDVDKQAAYYMKNRASVRAQQTEYYKKYYLEHKEELVEKARRRRYIMQNQGEPLLTIEEWFTVLEEHNYRCAYCNVEGSLERDHIVPHSKGGAYTLDNIVPACLPCNRSKGNTLLDDWRQE